MFLVIIYGLCISVGIGVGLVLIVGVIGMFIGLLVVYVGGKVDMVFMCFVDLVLFFFFILVVMLILVYVGKGIFNVMVMLVVLEWVYYVCIVCG